MSSRFLLVELEGGLDRSRHVGIWLAMGLIPGIRSVTDMSSISQETLDLMLMQPEPEAPLPVLPERVQQLTLA